MNPKLRPDSKAGRVRAFILSNPNATREECCKALKISSEKMMACFNDELRKIRAGNNPSVNQQIRDYLKDNPNATTEQAIKDLPQCANSIRNKGLVRFREELKNPPKPKEKQTEKQTEKLPEGATYEEELKARDNSFWREQYKTSRKKLEKALKDAVATDRLVSIARECAPLAYDPAPIVFRSIASKAGEAQSAFLILSDTHVGQVVTADQTLGFGHYDFATFCRRLAYVEQFVIRQAADHNSRNPTEELFVAMLGDMIHGALGHGSEADQHSTKFAQFYAAGHVIAQFLRNLAPFFPKIRVATTVGNHCLDMDSELLTNEGWKKPQDIREGQLCLGMNPDGTNVWQPFTFTQQKRVDRMVTIKNKMFDFRGTEHHRFYFQVPGIPRLIESRWSEIAGYCKQAPIHIPSAGMNPGDGAGVPDAMIELTAAVLTDGSIEENGVIIYQVKNTDWIVSALQRSGLEYTMRTRVRKAPKHICGRPWKGKPTVTEYSFRLQAESGRKFLESTGCRKGFLPPWVRNMTEAQMGRFLGALLDGDGTRRSDVSSILYGKSKELLDDLQSVLINYGISSSVKEYQPDNDNPNIQHRLLIRFDDRIALGSAAQVSYESDTNEDVWCVMTPTENFFCRRNGIAYLTGNTRWGDQKKMPTVNRYSNLDLFLYAYIKELVRDIPNIQLDINAQPFQVAEVQNTLFHLAHGDHLRGGDKALGIPNHSVARQIGATTQLFAKSGQRTPDYYCVGHFHRPIDIPHAKGKFLFNGGFPGLDGYALTGNFNPIEPSQAFFFVHPEYGVHSRSDIQIWRGDDKPHGYTLPQSYFPIE